MKLFVFILLFCLLTITTTQLCHAASPSSVSSVSIQSNQFYINNQLGVLNGFTFIGRLNPVNVTCVLNASNNYLPDFIPCSLKNSQAAWQLFGPNIVSASNTIYNANIVRLQVTVGYLDPKGDYYDPSYYVEVIKAVNMIRDSRMAVLVCMNWEDWKYLSNVTWKIDAGTTRAWLNLVNGTGWIDDSGILLELFNEPSTAGSPCEAESLWLNWQNDFQPIITALRNFGSKNILVVPAPRMQRVLDGSVFVSQNGKSLLDYLLNDPLNSLSYSMHPYPAPLDRPGDECAIGEYNSTDWNRWWGNLIEKVSSPIVVSEWYTGGFSDSPSCLSLSHQPPSDPAPFGWPPNSVWLSPDIAQQFTQYLLTNGPKGGPISTLGIYAFDVEGLIVADLANPSYPPTIFDALKTFECGDKIEVNGTDQTYETYQGPGELVQKMFKSMQSI